MPVASKREREDSGGGDVLRGIISDRLAEVDSICTAASSTIDAALAAERTRLSALGADRHALRERRRVVSNIAALEEESRKLAAKKYTADVERVAQKTIVEFNALVHNKKSTTAAAASSRSARRRQQDIDPVIEAKQKSLLEKAQHTLGAKEPLATIVSDDAVCGSCGSVHVRTITSRSTIVCTACGYSSLFLDASVSSLSFGDGDSFSNSQSFSYLRSNHFGDWLARVQAKESYIVPDETIVEVMQGLRDEGVAPKDVTRKRVLKVMWRKKMKSKNYAHVSQVVARITGSPPPRLSNEQDELAKLIFAAIQEPFARHAPPNRKNFLSYGYCLYRILELLGADELLRDLSLLSGKGKVAAQDDIMEKIFSDLDLEWTGRLE